MRATQFAKSAWLRLSTRGNATNLRTRVTRNHEGATVQRANVSARRVDAPQRTIEAVRFSKLAVSSARATKITRSVMTLLQRPYWGQTYFEIKTSLHWLCTSKNISEFYKFTNYFSMLSYWLSALMLVWRLIVQGLCIYLKVFQTSICCQIFIVFILESGCCRDFAFSVSTSEIWTCVQLFISLTKKIL